MEWLLVVMLWSGSEWMPAVYMKDLRPVQHPYATELQCIEAVVDYNSQHDITREKAVCVHRPR